MASIPDGMTWFKRTFGTQIKPAIVRTPYSLNLMTALATQETFEVWGNIFNSVPVAKVLAVCVGDTIDAPSRSAFPTSRAALEAIKNGPALFQVAREALEAVGVYNAAYHKIAQANKNKFCHGFGIFQYDLQYCKGADQNFFLEKKWYAFDECLARCIKELSGAQKAAGLGKKTVLTDLEAAYVAIAYNCGSFNPKRGLKQGFKDSSGEYYGELIAQYIAMASQIP